MCGICGVVSRNIKNIDQPDNAVQLMMSAMQHRGPDGAGVYSDAYVSLGMRRLSIIDLEGGWQPLYNEDNTIAVIANGEIYNSIELRRDLEKSGHVFSTGSDCEVIVHAYEQYGVSCLQWFRGMFAFALRDTERNVLFLARDRLGEKPLYLSKTAERFVFSSEMKSLLSSKLIDFELEPASVSQFFHYNYVPEPATILKDVYKLQAGCCLEIDLNLWEFEDSNYWNLEGVEPLFTDPVATIRDELWNVGKMIVRSDVPVGVALSGGLDSSIVTAIAHKTYPGVVHAFSVGYQGGSDCDERGDARDFAEYLGMPFHEVVLSVDDLIESFEDLIFATDDPVADIAGFGYLSVMRSAKENGISVMLQGQGGDEVFWGYPWIRQAVKKSNLKKIVTEEGLLQSEIAKHLIVELGKERSIRQKVSKILFLMKELLDYKTSKNVSEQFVLFQLYVDFINAESEVHRFCPDEFVEKIVSGENCRKLFTFEHPWPDIDLRITKIILQTYLLGNGITQGDRLGMASSVEMRLPLVDHVLIEKAVGLRKAGYDDINSPPKFLLKEAVKDILPEWVLNRPKRGFSPPTMEWYKALFQNFGSLLEEGFLVECGVLTNSSARKLGSGIMPPGAIMPFSFKAIVLEIWCRKMSRMCS